ncbi:MAG: hypothetical protein HY902_13255 [Deltaproteobacteria bacterium]|nr:hypothetical protein [Deltaproteobacteria bacterium]
MSTPPSTWRAVAPAFLSTRLGLLLWAWLCTALSPAQPGIWSPLPGLPLLDGWSRMDAGWYASIVRDGYLFTPGKACNVNFFPLYSWTVGLLYRPLVASLGEDAAFAAVAPVFNLLCLWLALLGLWRLAADGWGEAVARRTVWLGLIFPFSLFFSAVYTESLFLCLSVWAFAWGRQRRWALACAAASLAAVTRTVGFLVAVGLFVEYVAQQLPERTEGSGWRWPRLDRNLGWFFVTPLPLVALMGYFHTHFGHPLPFLQTYTTVWDKRPGLRRLIDLLNSLRHADVPHTLRFQNAVYLLVVFGTLAVVVLGRRKLSPGLVAYAALSTLLVMFTGFDASGRYMSVLFPTFLVLAQVLEGHRFRLALAAQVPLLLWFTWAFTQSLHIS